MIPWPANAGEERHVGLIPELGNSSGEGNGNPIQYSCLENPMDRGASHAIVHRVVKSQKQNPMDSGASHAIVHRVVKSQKQL